MGFLLFAAALNNVVPVPVPVPVPVAATQPAVAYGGPSTIRERKRRLAARTTRSFTYAAWDAPMFSFEDHAERRLRVAGDVSLASGAGAGGWGPGKVALAVGAAVVVGVGVGCAGYWWLAGRGSGGGLEGSRGRSGGGRR